MNTNDEQDPAILQYAQLTVEAMTALLRSARGEIATLTAEVNMLASRLASGEAVATDALDGIEAAKLQTLLVNEFTRYRPMHPAGLMAWAREALLNCAPRARTVPDAHTAHQPAAAQAAPEWTTAQHIADLHDVDAALRGFSEDATGDNGIGVVRAVMRALAAGAPGETVKQTDLSKRLRESANAVMLQDDRARLMVAAAEEIERYYGGMMAWKQTAEKKDRDWSAERMARVDERCKSRAAPASQAVNSEVALGAEAARAIRRAVRYLNENGCTGPAADLEALLATNAAAKASTPATPVCAVCNGTRLVDDGEIDCYPNGEPYMCGPVKCVTDCPACALVAPAAPAVPSAPLVASEQLTDAQIYEWAEGYQFSYKGNPHKMNFSRPRFIEAVRTILSHSPAHRALSVDQAKRLVGGEVAAGWQSITAPGQVKVGDKLRFNIGDEQFKERVKQIINEGRADEELIYNKRKNYYVITKNVLTGFGNVKNFQFLRASTGSATSTDTKESA